MFRRRVPASIAAACLVLAACGGDDDASSTTTSTTVASTTTPAAQSSSTTTVASTTTTTVPPLVTEGATVVVANASIVGGSAGRMTDQLAGEGFTTGAATDGAEDLEESVVYYTDDEGAQAVAESVGRVLGDVEVGAMPDPIPTESGELGDAQVLVLLGNAQADQSLDDLGGGTGDDGDTDDVEETESTDPDGETDTTEADGDDAATDTTDPDGETDTTDADADDADDEDGESATPVESNGLTIVVANASGIDGSAGRLTTRLENAGFTLGTATDGVVSLDDTVVHYTDTEGAQAEAEAVAAALGGVEVEPLPDEIPTEASALDGDVLVLLGRNQADQPLDT